MKKIYKIAAMVLISVMMVIFLGQGFTYSSEISCLRVPLGTDKYRAGEAIELLSGSKIKKELSKGVRVLRGYNDILSGKGAKLLRKIEDCLRDFNLQKAEALAKQIPTLENMEERLDLFVGIKLPDVIYADRDSAVCVQFNEGCYNQCLICQPDSKKQYKYMPYPVALKLLDALHERNFERLSEKMPFITHILPYDANDPLHYRDKVIGADFSDIYREVIKRFEVLTIITNGWDTRDRVAQKGAEKLASILKKEDTIKLSFHFFYEPLLEALKNNDQEEVDRIYRRLKDKFKNVLMVFKGNIQIIPRNLGFYTAQLPGFPEVITRCYDLQKKALREIEEELRSDDIDVAYADINDDNLVMWNYGRPRNVLDKLGFNEKTPGTEDSIYSSPGTRLEYVFRPDGRLEVVTNFSFRIGEYIKSAIDKDFLSLLLYMKVVLSQNIPVYAENSSADAEKNRKLRYFETRIDASPAFHKFLESIVPARYPDLYKLIADLDMINLERSKAERAYELIKDIEVPYVGFVIKDGFDLDYAIVQRKGKDYIDLSFRTYAPDVFPAITKENRPVSLNPLRHPAANFREAYNVLKSLSVTYYKTSRGSL